MVLAQRWRINRGGICALAQVFFSVQYRSS
jgi:hypothetical protein